MIKFMTESCLSWLWESKPRLRTPKHINLGKNIILLHKYIIKKQIKIDNITRGFSLHTDRLITRLKIIISLEQGHYSFLKIILIMHISVTAWNTQDWTLSWQQIFSQTHTIHYMQDKMTMSPCEDKCEVIYLLDSLLIIIRKLWFPVSCL